MSSPGEPSQKDQIEALINWINTFAISTNVKIIKELFDGVIISEVFAQIAPSYGDMSSLKRASLNNWVLRKANIKLLLANVAAFYSEELNIACDTAHINIELLVKNEDSAEMINLIELILGAAIECENKKEYIQNIMLLDETSQRILMLFIERLLREHQSRPPASPQTHHHAAVDDDDGENQLKLHSLLAEKEELQQRYEEIQIEHSSLSSENINLRSEKETLLIMVRELEKQLEEKTKIEETEKERREREEAELINALQKQSREISEEQYHALQVEIEEKEQTIIDYKRKIEELSKYAAEARKLRDEMDIIREKVTKADQIEDKLGHLQDKLKEMTELRKQYKALQEQNTAYMQRSIELEEEVVKIPLLKAQIEDYKKQVLAFRSEAAAKGERGIKQQLEMQQLQEALRQIQSERTEHQEKVETLEATITQLKAELEETKLASGLKGFRDPTSDEGGISDIHEIFQLQTKIAQLERENARLKSEIGEGGVSEQLAILRAKLDDAVSLNTTYEEKLRSLTNQLSSGNTGSGQNGMDNLQEELANKDATITSLVEKLKKAEEQAQIYRAGGVGSQDTLGTGGADNVSKEKNDSLMNEKLRLEGYLRTAKKMIKELRMQTQVDAEKLKGKKELEETLDVLRAQIQDKEKEIKQLKETIRESSESTEREQRLLVSSFYDVGLQLARAQASRPEQGTSEVLTPMSHHPQSWLAAIRNARAK